MNGITSASMPPVTLSRKTHSLFWKEWRSRAGLHIVLFALLLFYAAIMRFSYGRSLALPLDKVFSFIPWASFLVGTLIFGTVLFSREESEPARCWLYTLPISRSGVVRQKILTLLLQGLTLLSLGMLSAFMTRDFRQLSAGTSILITVRVGLTGLVLLLLAAAVSIHLRRPMMAFLLAVFTCLIIWPSMWLSIGLYGAEWQLDRPLEDCAKCVLLVAVTGLGLTLLLTRTRIQELPSIARTGVLLVLLILYVQAVYTHLLAGWSDLWFLLTGG